LTSLQQILINLSRSLYPIGRAFRMPRPDADSPPSGGIFYRLHRALAQSEARAYNDALAIRNSLLPDNDGFTIDDAHDWYRRLGIYDSGLVPLADMKLAIAQRQSFPLTPLNKQSLTFIQQQLRAAGFNVYVYKNRFLEGSPPSYVTKTPGVVLGSVPSGLAVLNNFTLGDVFLNEQWIDSGVTLCVNYIEEEKDAVFIMGNQYKETFFICGDPLGTFATVDVNRKIEFRQLILKLKAAHMCAFLFVNYI
jgi:hypothetical protein